MRAKDTISTTAICGDCAMQKGNLNADIIEEIGKKTIEIAEMIGWHRTKEQRLDVVVLTLLHERVGRMRFQYQVGNGRIDFRYGGTNPAFIELVVRRHGNEHNQSQNKKEIRKLCRVKNAKQRYLLIVDLTENNPLTVEKLREQYKKAGPGSGRSYNKPIMVVYVHQEDSFHFRWSPDSTSLKRVSKS